MKYKRMLSILLSALLLAAALPLLCACGGRAPVETPAPTTPAETRPPEPEVTEEPLRIFSVRRDGTPFSGAPEMPQELQTTLAQGSDGIWLEESGDYVKLQLSDGAEVWIHRWYLSALDEAEQQAWEEAWLAVRTASPSYSPADEFLTEEDHSVTCIAGNGLNGRAEASADSLSLTVIPFGTKLTVLGRDNGFYLCRMEDGALVYCSAAYLTTIDSYVSLEGAVDLRVYLPTLEFEMLFASPNNITGEAMYPAIPLLETSTAEMLARAQEIFRSNGLSIKIYDAYRPKSAQFKLYDIVQNSWFIANPYQNNSWHQFGRAVDMSLIDLETGEELEMPTPMHTFTTDACRFNSGLWTEEARQNVEYMTQVMTYVGFGTITTEWWHFENTHSGNYMDVNLDFDSLTYLPISDYIPE